MPMGWSRSGVAVGALVLIYAIVQADSAFVGVVYGYTENGPNPDQAVQLLRANGVYQVRIYDTNPLVLSAFANTSLEVVVGVTNQELPAVGESNITAANWVKSNLLPFTPWLNITGIAVGSEVLTSSAGNLSSMLVPAMRYIHAALVSVGLDSQIKVTTPHNVAVLESSFPPSQGAFNKTYLPVIVPLLNFLAVTDSYFMLNLYPYFSYQANSQAISLPYALFEPNGGMSDSYTNARYISLYDALLDAAYAAMNTLNSSQLLIVVSETGWPSAGDSNEIGPSITNAQAYNGNLAKRVYNKTGTPQKPYDVSSVYIYELFNEESRTGPLSERSWGLFNTNTTPVYSIDLTGTGRAVVGNSTNSTWCIPKQGVTEQALQFALDYACGEGAANCTAIQNNGVCWLPNTVKSHASFAMNAYYQKEGEVESTCDFKGLGVLTYIDPSYDSCVYIMNVTAQNANQGISPDYSSAASVLPFHTGLFINNIILLSFLLAVSASLLRL